MECLIKILKGDHVLSERKIPSEHDANCIMQRVRENSIDPNAPATYNYQMWFNDPDLGWQLKQRVHSNVFQII